jgi:phospholipid-binding lipoprotein MlaA
MNRQIFAFNEVLDQELTRPVAEAYQAIVPQIVRRGVTNFYGNLGDAWSTTNLLLQAKPRQALEMGMRTLVNTSFGLGGVLDFAEDMGLERFTVEDVGQTLGYWGIATGPYVVLPFLGPSTVRDGVGLVVDYQQSAINYVFDGVAPRNAAGLLNLLNSRANLLSAGRVFDEIALDRYTLMRDGYLARRRSQLYDGEPPDDEPASAPYKSQLPGELFK